MGTLAYEEIEQTFCSFPAAAAVRKQRIVETEGTQNYISVGNEMKFSISTYHKLQLHNYSKTLNQKKRIEKSQNKMVITASCHDESL